MEPCRWAIADWSLFGHSARLGCAFAGLKDLDLFGTIASVFTRDPRYKVVEKRWLE